MTTTRRKRTPMMVEDQRRLNHVRNERIRYRPGDNTFYKVSFDDVYGHSKLEKQQLSSTRNNNNEGPQPPNILLVNEQSHQQQQNQQNNNNNHYYNNNEYDNYYYDKFYNHNYQNFENSPYKGLNSTYYNDSIQQQTDFSVWRYSTFLASIVIVWVMHLLLPKGFRKRFCNGSRRRYARRTDDSMPPAGYWIPASQMPPDSIVSSSSSKNHHHHPHHQQHNRRHNTNNAIDATRIDNSNIKTKSNDEFDKYTGFGSSTDSASAETLEGWDRRRQIQEHHKQNKPQLQQQQQQQQQFHHPDHYQRRFQEEQEKIQKQQQQKLKQSNRAKQHSDTKQQQQLSGSSSSPIRGKSSSDDRYEVSGGGGGDPSKRLISNVQRRGVVGSSSSKPTIRQNITPTKQRKQHSSSSSNDKTPPSPEHPALKKIPPNKIIAETMGRLQGRGIRLVAHGVQCDPKRVWIRLEEDTASVTWQTEFPRRVPNNSGEVSIVLMRGSIHRIPLCNVLYIDIGKRTNALMKLDTSSVPEKMCFSLLTQNGSLDLQANSKLERDALVSCFSMILDDVHTEDWRALYEASPEPSTVTSTNDDNNDDDNDGEGTEVPYASDLQVEI